MAKLYFYYGAMNAGKSTHLLQAAHNYEERGMSVKLVSYYQKGVHKYPHIKSRIGVKRRCFSFLSLDYDLNSLDSISINISVENEKLQSSKTDCILIDESQFLSKRQVDELVRIVDELKIPVMCYGLRTDFQGNLFEGSAALLALADEIIEIKSICHCGKKATMQARIDSEGKRVREGEQVMIGGNESYVSLCRRHFYERSIL